MSETIDLDAVALRLRAKIGARGNSKLHKVEPGALIKFARATGQTYPHFLDEEHDPVAAPTWLSRYCADACAGLIELDIGLAAFLSTELNPVRDIISASWQTSGR